MSTRACYVFKEKGSNTPGYGVYKHHDGYPTGAASHIEECFKKKAVWELPRWEADEFGAGFISANKESGGGCRLLETANLSDMPPDIEFLYIFTNYGTDMNSNVSVQAYSTTFWEARTEEDRQQNIELLFECRLSNFTKAAKEYENKTDKEAV